MNLLDEEYDFLRCQIDWMSWELDLPCDFKYSYGETTYKNAAKIAGHTNLLMEGHNFNHWWIAAQHQLMILGPEHSLIHYYVFKDEREPIDLIVKRDDEFIEKYRKKAVDWWTAYVAMDRPPPRDPKLQLLMDQMGVIDDAV
jgi:hypothetical protein